MFITKIKIKNYRLFSADKYFEIPEINIPNGSEGSGLTVFVGENGCGKTSLLEAISLPLLEYKTENFTIHDLNSIEEKVEIEIIAGLEFEVDKTVPRGNFKARGFKFDGGLRSRESGYLSSVVKAYRWFIPADGENIRDGSPDLRVDVDNPYKGRRFKENDVLYLDKNRIYQIHSGTYKNTRFDRLMEDFNYQYIDGQNRNVKNLSDQLNKEVKAKIGNKFLAKAVKKFEAMTGISITLELIDNHMPFENAFLGQGMKNNLQVKIERLGSGYEMIFSLLYSFYLAEQSERQLIVLLDEPELHLHPKLQENFIDILLELSKKSQVLLTTQSPLFIKQLSYNERVKVEIIDKDEKKKPMIISMKSRLLPYASVNETNYLAFGLPTVEFHDELYGFLHQKYIDNATDEQEAKKRSYLDEFDDYLKTKTTQTRKWTPEQGWTTKTESDITLQTFIRNKIHHSENKTMQDKNFTDKELRQSIDEMIKII